MLLLRPVAQLVPPLLLAAASSVTVVPVALAFAGAPQLPKAGSSTRAMTTAGSCPAAAAAADSSSTTGGGISSGTPISRLGFGTYRVGGSAEQAAAIREALLNGITLVDTSANYGDGESEATIGRVVRELVGEGKLRREDVVLVSKFGYIQGQNLRRYESGEVVTPDTVHYGPGIKHCVHPQFMEDQLARALERSGLSYLDVFLLHNPEYYLTHSIKPGNTTAEEAEGHRAEMSRRIFEAFKALEAEIASGRGRLLAYGISSNSFSLAADHPHFLRYDHLLDLAAKAAAEATGKPSAKHHFTTVQMPGNLLEQEGIKHAVPWAARHGLTVLINRPLNAFTDAVSLRLAEYDDARPEYEEAKRALLAFIEAQAPSDPRYQTFRNAVLAVDRQLQGAVNVLAWDSVAGRLVVPALRQGLEATAAADGTFDPEGMRLAQAFLTASEHLVAYRSGAHARQECETTLGFGPLPPGKSLQEFAIEWLLAQEGVTCVLLGCRNTRYVKDVIKLVKEHPPVAVFEP